MAPRLNRGDYTVGWVCALPIELSAAQEMLDEVYPSLPPNGNDTNVYTLGCIGEHNVVLAGLPAGKTGTASAASVAMQMKATFSAIRFGLMVGIGGGVPSKEADIRLGDIVVSQPANNYGGVVQYDFGKSIPGGFKPTGLLNAPPQILLSAVTKLRANYDRGQSNTSLHLSKLSRLPKFARDQAGSDVLFEGDYNHTSGDSCMSCDNTRRVRRKERADKMPNVHYGTIASGNQVMRDGATRDKISSHFGGVLCFEMEAGGLMDNFPCMIVRGICDYADSHKNKRWQPYAAGTAAAYTKELLLVVPAIDVASTLTIDEANALHDVLKTIPITAEAPFNAYQRQHDPRCLPDTRVKLLREIYDWADGRDERCIFWLNGLAGTGKSTIARTVARKYYDQKRLGASFFFSRGGGDVSHAGKFVTSIAWQLASNVPTLDQYVCDVIKERRDIASQSLRDQWQQLVLRPLSRLSGSSGSPFYMLVVDALDECDNDKDIRLIVHLLAEAQSLEMARLRVFLTSRPEVPIRNGFVDVPDDDHKDFILHNISPSIIDQDISIFLKHDFELIAKEGSLDTGWPGPEIIKRLVCNASGLFIWAATVCRFVREGKRFARKRLNDILENSSVGVNAAEKRLNEIYITVLRSCIFAEYLEEEVEELRSILKGLLGSIITLLSPLSTQSLSKLLHTAQVEVDQTLDDLHAILYIPKDPTLPLRLHHPSFRDFLFEKSRCEEFWVDEKQAHQDLADRCIKLMEISLKQDICSVKAPNILIADAETAQIEQYLPLEVQYACRYWIDHVQKSGTQLYDDSQVHRFLQKYLLYWLEALGWMKKLSDGIHAISTLESFVSSKSCPGLWSFLRDTKRFVLFNRRAIEQAPLQTYSSALIFAPASSIVKDTFKACIPKWMRVSPKVEEKWNALQQTLEGHTSPVNSVAFSPDGKTLASASSDHTLWDAGSGALLQTNRGSLPVSSFSFTRSAVSHQVASPSIFVKKEWVCSQTGPILWLPPEHRPDHIAVHGGAVGFGYRSGRVTVIELAL
ncbi:hypothetical protein K402DRAFT_394897 [Aulographum hederae CBS 113979]|uniref:Uncharacterized protein n=1 Tax=Aulographum hederae CBS 113979 TaxID=1176131 RepID=A0A6G1GWR5_9PEZI|nr:hypothetical protein K402DRAFT_394897 [Aulographum hederae CBS 113979]